ncbi:hypothetical protein MPER_07650 [Moniliophthora perniciosa FA553]|nr:hypothetical protein MPER_07650 [Moniliophthora perniciosa FA553]
MPKPDPPQQSTLNELWKKPKSSNGIATKVKQEKGAKVEQKPAPEAEKMQVDEGQQDSAESSKRKQPEPAAQNNVQKSKKRRIVDSENEDAAPGITRQSLTLPMSHYTYGRTTETQKQVTLKA